MTRKLHRKEKVALQYDERFGAIECILFVSGDPVPVIQLQRALGLTDIEMQSTLQSMDELYRREERGIQLYLTEEDRFSLFPTGNIPILYLHCCNLFSHAPFRNPCWRRSPLLLTGSL